MNANADSHPPGMNDIGRGELAARIGECISVMSRHGGSDDGGVVRLAYTAAWRGAMDELRSWFLESGLSVRRDAVGNLFGRAAGSDDDSRVILTGSHIDSIVQGGRYDGTAGVVCSYVALTTLLRRHGTPRRSIEVVAIADEESSRFSSNFWGSRALVGRVGDDELDALLDADGVSVRTAMRECGLPDESVASCQRGDIDAYVELHIEQGPVLEREGLPVGVVSGITGAHWSDHTVTGVSNHAGGTPMAERRDAMQAAAEMVSRVDEVTRDFGDGARGTVGQITASPGAANAIAASVTFSADLRHSDPQAYRPFIDQVHNEFRSIAARRQVGLQAVTNIDEPPTPMTGALVERLRAAVHSAGLAERVLPSGGGHDAMVLARHGIPSGMIFVRCRGGVSHSPAEYADARDLAAATDVLIQTIYDLAYESGTPLK